MPSLTRSLQQQLHELDQFCPYLSPSDVLRTAVDSERIYIPSLAESNRFCLVRLADDWPIDTIHHLIQLFSDAMIQPSELLRFHYAQAIGELTGRHKLPLIDQARRFVDPLPQEKEYQLELYFSYFLNAYQQENNDHSELLNLEKTLRQTNQAAWITLVFQLPQAALDQSQYQIAQTIQSLDGLRLLQRFYHSGYDLPEPKPTSSVLVQYERMQPSAQRSAFVNSVKSTTELMIGSLTDTAPKGLKHSTIDFLADRARLDPDKRAFNTMMHLIQLMKLDSDITAGLHARDSAVDLLPLLRPSEIDRLVIELKNSLGVSSSNHAPIIPRLLAEALLRSPANKWNQLIDYLHDLIKVGNPLQSMQSIQTIYYLLHRSGSVELQSALLLCLLTGVAHHREELAIMSITTIGQLLWIDRLDTEAIQTIMRKLLIAMEHRLTTSPQLAYFYQPIRQIIADYIEQYPQITHVPQRRPAFFPGSFDPFSLGHEAVAKAVAELGYDVYIAIDEFSWSKRTQPNRIRREIMRLSIADELHLYEFPESFSINIANDADLSFLQSTLGEEVALVVGEDVIRGASAYRQAKKIRQFHHLIFARKIDSDIEQVAADLNISAERIPLRGYEKISSSLIRSGLESQQDISQLIDPLARQFIYDHDAYKDPQYTKDALTLNEPPYRLMTKQRQHELTDPSSGAVVRYTIENKTIILLEAEGNCLDLVCDVLAEGCRTGMEQARSQIDLEELELIGFMNQSVDLRSPCSLHFDLDDLIKDEYRNEEAFLQVLARTRQRMLLEIGKLFPGHFVLPIYQHRVYQRLAQAITSKNSAEIDPSSSKRLGPYLAVPFGEILKRRVLPNTATKSIHTEKCFEPDLSRWQIQESPDYMALRNQVQMIKSFDRPVLLVDDLLNKGYRLKRLMPLFQECGLKVDTLYLGLISQRGREIASSYQLAVKAAYELPNLRHWFAESKSYPYLGGDSIYQVKSELSLSFWPSINLIFPYSRTPFLKAVPRAQQYAYSATCLDNAIELLEVLEKLYQERTYRYPQLRHLPELIYLPRYPFHGRGIYQEESLKPSHLLRQDREWLERLR